jgi:hypothetical protein
MGKLVTAGCGISQLGFDKWPTWPKYAVLTHQCNHLNVGGPASGNEHIARSVMRAVYENDVDCLIIIWTSYNKLDVYIEDSDKEQQIKNFPTRNFLIDYQGKIVSAPGWWPSSVSDDNIFKKVYKETIESKTYYYIKTLESILTVQNLVKLRNIPCYMFLGYDFDFNYIKESNELKYLYSAIDWDMFITMESIEANYIKSNWFAYNTSKANGMIPVASWHYDFYVREIIPLLDRHYIVRDLTKFNNLKDEILQITQSRYAEGIS